MPITNIKPFQIFLQNMIITYLSSYSAFKSHSNIVYENRIQDLTLFLITVIQKQKWILWNFNTGSSTVNNLQIRDSKK